MRILVTGISGQIGSAVAHSFSPWATVIGTDRSTLDLSKPDQISVRLDALAPEAIVNAAAYTAVDRAEDERDLAFAANAAAPREIARWSAKRGVPLVHFSTDYVFDGSGDRPWREDDAARPVNAYGASKLAGEKAVRAAGGPHLVVRTSWVYGATGNNFFRTISRLARERNELSVVADQSGSPTSAPVLAEIIGNIVRSHMDDLPAAFASAQGLLHIAASGQTTWYEFATAIVDGLKSRHVPVVTQRLIPIATKDYPAKAARPLQSRLDLTRLREVFNIVPLPWRESLGQTLDLVAGTPRRA